MTALKVLALVALGICAVGQALLRLAIFLEHRPSASRVSFLLVKIPRTEDLTSRGQKYAAWWWITVGAGVAAFLFLFLAH